MYKLEVIRQRLSKLFPNSDLTDMYKSIDGSISYHFHFTVNGYVLSCALYKDYKKNNITLKGFHVQIHEITDNNQEYSESYMSLYQDQYMSSNGSLYQALKWLEKQSQLLTKDNPKSLMLEQLNFKLK